MTKIAGIDVYQGKERDGIESTKLKRAVEAEHGRYSLYLLLDEELGASCWPDWPT